MKVMVTGGTGFIGAHAVEALQAEGHPVRLLVRDPERARRILKERGLEALEIAVGDIADARAVRKGLEGCQAVIHAAATMYGGDRVRADNVAGVHNVVGIALEMGLDPILYVSSIAAIFPPSGPVMTVDDPVAGLPTTYGRSKAEGERFARELQAKGAPVVTIYPVGVYGPRDLAPSPVARGLIARIRWVWPITSGGVACVDVRDLARIITAALRPGKGPRRFMAGGHFLSWAEEADLCDRITGRKVLRVPVPGFAVRGMGRSLDWVRKVISIDYPLSHETGQFATRFVPCNSRSTVEQLGVAFRPPEQTLTDAIRWLCESGRLNARLAPKLATPDGDGGRAGR